MKLNGKYLVIYKDPRTYINYNNKGVVENNSLKKFVGYCENFTTSGLIAFSNENGEMLLVKYYDIIQMRLIGE